MTAAKASWHDGYVPTTTPPYTGPSTSKTTTTTKTPGPGECTHGKYYPDPNDCAHYTLCSNNNQIPFDCAPGLYFDENIGTCNWASEVDCCNGQRPCQN